MRYKVLSLSIILVFIISSCAPKHSDIIVADYEVNKIKMDEFENAYAKNAGSFEAAKEDSLLEYENFLDLYVVYRMKLRDAFVRGYYNDDDLNNELNEYKEKVGVSYLEEKAIVAPGMKKFYDQRREEVRVSHIMIKIDTSAEASKVKAQTILDSIKNGANFEDMAAKYSDDRFSKNNGGDIYWFIAGQIVPSFEVPAYNIPVGEVASELVKTNFGYHIIKVTDRQDRKYKISAQHILIKTEKDGEVDSNFARNLATILYEKIQNGESFDSLAAEYSDDKSNAPKGGDLGYFERRQMVQPFDEAVFNLKVGEISPIVETRFGFHIIKLTDIKDYPPYEEEIDNIREIYKKSRYQYDYDQYMSELQKEFNYSVNNELIDSLSLEKNKIFVNDTLPENESLLKFKNDMIFKLNEKAVTADSLFTFMIRDKSFSNQLVNKDILNKGIQKYSTQLLLSEKAAQLESADPEFAKLMNDYRHGIYIFKLQEDEVWNKIKVDSTELRKLYNDTKENYLTKEQVSFSEIYASRKGDIDKYFSMLKDGEDFDSVAAKHTERKEMYKTAGNHGLKDISDGELAQKANAIKKIGDYSEVFKVKNGYSIVRLNERVAPRVKTYEEALPELSSTFQEMESKRLEQSYDNRLKEFYKPQYFYDELANAFEPENK